MFYFITIILQKNIGFRRFRGPLNIQACQEMRNMYSNIQKLT